MNSVGSTVPRLPVSVVMLTLNEEHNLPGVIDNLRPWAGEIFVVDSFSSDSTVSLALERGVQVVQRKFTSFGDQWNAALAGLPITTPWTMKLDPDERVTAGLLKEIAQVTRSSDACDGYDFARRLWFMGKPLHLQQNVLRLWKTGRCRFSNVLVNEHPIIDGRVGHICGNLEHLDSPDLHHWCEKQNRYTTMEAIMHSRDDQLSAAPRLLGTPLERRMFLKKHFTKLPLRYHLLFLYCLLGQGVWRDGVTGFAWARLRTEVYRMIQLKSIEIQRTGKIPALPRGAVRGEDPRVVESMLQKDFEDRLSRVTGNS